MAFELYFSVSRTAVEILAICAVTAAGVYLVKDLMGDEDKEPVINPIEG